MNQSPVEPLPPGARLSDAIIKILAQFGLPHIGMLKFDNLQRARIVHDYGHLRRLKEIGFPPGRWLSANLRIWTPEEIGTYLLNLPTERPKLPPELKRPRPPNAQRPKPVKRSARRPATKRRVRR
jgi:hypothetical protein